MPSNMTFGVNILPETNNTYTLGNRGQKWKLYINNINGETYQPLPAATNENEGKVLKVINGSWNIGTIGG